MLRLLILDEPTAALNEDDCDNLLNLIKDLKNQGVTSIMISHKLKEVIRICRHRDCSSGWTDYLHPGCQSR